MDETLRSYAARGVFRGFSADEGPGGVRRYRFTWLTRQPTTVTVSRDRRVLTFPSLLPAIDSIPRLREAVKAQVRSKASTTLPAHRRVDARRAILTTRVEGGDLTFRVSVLSRQGRDGAYGVRAALGAVNDLFLFLHEMYPDYLVAHFGVSQE